MQQRPPALQRASSRLCVSCGAQADSFCARCEVTPYCSQRCQRRDWGDRHRSVCHNLARPANVDLRQGSSITPDLTLIETVTPPAAPLRRPHSPTQRNVRKEDVVDRQKIHPAGSSSKMGQNNNQTRMPFNNKSTVPFNNRNNDNKQQNRPFNRTKQTPNNQANVVEEKWTTDNNDQPAEVPKQIPPMRKPHDVPKTGFKAKFENKPREQPKANFTPKPEKPKPDVQPIPKMQLASVENVTPVKKIVPKNYLVELLPIGSVVLLSVDALASDCRAGDTGFVCLSLSEIYGADYELLCDAYATACEHAEAVKPTPGQCFSYLDPTDGAWYRARCLTPNLGALLDAGRLVTLRPEDSIRALPQEYEDKPEFCCLLKGADLNLGVSLKCTVKSKLPECSKVSIENAESGVAIGHGEICRWLPRVDIAAPANHVGIPEIRRPDLKNGSKVLLVEAADPKRALVRCADNNSKRRYDSALHGPLLIAQGAEPLKSPPQKGQLVIAKYSDGHHYRALCKRTNVTQNKYLLEYVEYGNTEIAKLADIFECPEEFDLNSLPAEASVVSLKCNVTAFTTPAAEYIESLTEGAVELVLTLCSGAETEPSGAEVILTVADTKVSVNDKLEEMCTPDWKKMEQKGADVVESPALMYSDLEYLALPINGCEIEVLDMSALENGSISGYQKGEKLAKSVFEDLPKQLEAYCSSEIGKEPYLPKYEELCITQCPPYPQWFRAVFCEQVDGAGGNQARVCFIDYGNIESVDVGTLRKMMPEFVKGKPALASYLEIRDFPKEPTEEMLAKAFMHMNINEEGRGCLKVSRCQKIEPGMYIVDAPELVDAMNS